MAWKHLGEAFDIHGGGIDLKFPHHENELAQTCCAFHADRMANVWMHNGFLQVESEKMSKSLGNFVTIRELLESDTFGGQRWSGGVLRLTMLKTHYRSPIDWTLKTLEESHRTMLNWANVLKRASTGFTGQGSLAPSVRDALLDDLNTPKALAEMHKLAEAARKGDIAAGQSLHDTGKWLGLMDFSLMSSSDLSSVGQAALLLLAPELRKDIEAKIKARTEARERKDFKESDRIRDELAELGVTVKDGKDANGNPTSAWEVAR